MHNSFLRSLILLFALLTGCAASPGQRPGFAEEARPEPESSSAYTEKPGWTARQHMVASANPLATAAGVEILEAGGTAVDAAVAAQMVLTLVEPQSSGIGGGAFLLHFDGFGVRAYDGRETAPASANEDLFRRPDGNVMRFHEGVVGGRSVGVPGVLRMLALAHRHYGKLEWSALFAPAIRLADRGFAVSPRLHQAIAADRYLRQDPAAAAYFYAGDGTPWPTGHVLRNPALADTLRDIAHNGPDAFYEGRIAQDIADKVQRHPVNPGGLTAADIAAYEPKVRVPVCTGYRVWLVCGMPPPSSGGIAVAQMLGMLELRDIRPFPPKNGEPDAEAVHLFSEAGRLAYADRDRYVADPDFAPLPDDSVQPLLDERYLAQRAALITEKSMGTAQPGKPFVTRFAWGDDQSPELPSTSHLSIVDRFGNAVSMTSSIEDAFGARQMVRGFLLNNQLTDFSFVSADANGPIANRVQPGKRPRSSMSPTLVFDRRTGALQLVTGSPGGSAIINYVGKVLVATLDWGLNIQEAISLPNFGSRNGPTELEQGRVSGGLIEALKAKGHQLRLMDQASGLQGIERQARGGETVWFGGADPRREGVAAGD